MRMHWIDRVLIGLAGFILVIVGVCLALLLSKVVDAVGTFTLDLVMGDSVPALIGVGLLAALIILWGVRLIVFAVRNMATPRA